MKQVLLPILILTVASCGNNASTDKSLIRDTVYQTGHGLTIVKNGDTSYSKGNDTTKTIVHFIFNANTNDFRTSASVRFAVDTVIGAKRVQDTLYNIAAFQKIVDSAGAVVKAKSGVDSVRLVWLGYEKKWILHDYNINYEDYLPKVDSTKK